MESPWRIHSCCVWARFNHHGGNFWAHPLFSQTTVYSSRQEDVPTAHWEVTKNRKNNLSCFERCSEKDPSRSRKMSSSMTTQYLWKRKVLFWLDLRFFVKICRYAYPVERLKVLQSVWHPVSGTKRRKETGHHCFENDFWSGLDVFNVLSQTGAQSHWSRVRSLYYMKALVELSVDVLKTVGQGHIFWLESQVWLWNKALKVLKSACQRSIQMGRYNQKRRCSLK